MVKKREVFGTRGREQPRGRGGEGGRPRNLTMGIRAFLASATAESALYAIPSRRDTRTRIVSPKEEAKRDRNKARLAHRPRADSPGKFTASKSRAGPCDIYTIADYGFESNRLFVRVKTFHLGETSRLSPLAVTFRFNRVMIDEERE